MAASHTNTQSLTTAQVKQLIQEKGSVVLSTSQNQFDRYVADQGQCFMGETASAAFVPTADSSAALVGFTCSVDADKQLIACDRPIPPHRAIIKH